jgi:hypothetical protein
MTTSPADQLHALLITLERELTEAEKLPLPTDVSFANNQRVILQMTRIVIATVQTAIIFIEGLESATATYCALRSGSGKNLLN